MAIRLNDKLIVTDNSLGLPHPHQQRGARLLILAVLLFAVVAHRFPTIAASTQQLRHEGPNLSGAGSAPLAALVAAGIWMACTFVLVIRGLRQYARPHAYPKKTPPLSLDPGDLQDLFEERVVLTYRTRFNLIQELLGLLLPRFKYLTEPAANALQFAAISSVASLSILVVSVLATQFPFRDPTASRHGGLPNYFIACLALITLFSILAAWKIVGRIPLARISEHYHHLDDMGHPVSFFYRMREAFEGIRYKDFPNRWVEVEPAVDETRLDTGGKFRGQLMVETQPVPIQQWISWPAVAYGAGASLLTLLLAMVTVDVAPQLLVDDRLYSSDGLFLTETILLSLICIVSYSHYEMQLCETYQFHSEAFRVEIKGTYTGSRISLGDGRGTTLHSDRVSVQSDMHFRFKSALLITESAPLHAKRVILSSNATPKFDQQSERFIEEKLIAIEQPEQSLPSINVKTIAAQNMIATNQEIVESVSRATQQNDTVTTPSADPDNVSPKRPR